MTQEFNPYQPPTTDTIKINPNGEYWVEGKFLVMPLTKEPQVLPHRCVYCNKPIENLTKKKIYWHNPLLILLIFLNLLIYLVVALIVRKKVTLYLGICKEHKQKRLIKIVIACTIVFLSIFLAFNSIIEIRITFLITLIGIIYLTVVSNLLSIRKIKNDLVYFSRCGKPFLDSLPKNSL